MKILAIVDGHIGGTGEFFARAALAGARDCGAEVQLVNLRALKLGPCTGCGGCGKNRKSFERGNCVQDDDMNWLDEQYLSSDGVIVVAPCYESSPPSGLKLLCDRIGPSHDLVMMRQMSDKLEAEGKPGADPRWFIDRPVAYISHGGSEWTTLGLPVMQLIAVPISLRVVDKVTFSFNFYSVLHEGAEERARELGRHVAENCGKSGKEMRYYGDEGHCPVCHNNVMVLGERADDVTCSVCGVRGRLSVEDGKIRVAYTEEELRRSHVTWTGKVFHAMDMQAQGNQKMNLTDEEKKTISEKIRASAADASIPRSRP